MFSENLWKQTQTEQSPEETQWFLLNRKNEFNEYRVGVGGGWGKKEGKGVYPVKYSICALSTELPEGGDRKIIPVIRSSL